MSEVASPYEVTVVYSDIAILGMKNFLKDQGQNNNRNPLSKTINTSNLSVICIQYFYKAVSRKYWFIATALFALIY